jgi:hypothetical protein
MLDPKRAPAPGDPAWMAARIIDSVDLETAPLRMVLGSQALEAPLQPCASGSLALPLCGRFAAGDDVFGLKRGGLDILRRLPLLGAAKCRHVKMCTHF